MADFAPHDGSSPAFGVGVREEISQVFEVSGHGVALNVLRFSVFGEVSDTPGDEFGGEGFVDGVEFEVIPGLGLKVAQDFQD